MKYLFPLEKKQQKKQTAFFTVPFTHIFCKTAYQEGLAHSTLEGQ